MPAVNVPSFLFSHSGFPSVKARFKIIIIVSYSLLISFLYFTMVARFAFRFEAFMEPPNLKPDGKRMSRSQAISMTSPLASPLTSPMISPVTSRRSTVSRFSTLWWVPCLAVSCAAVGYIAGFFHWPLNANTKAPVSLVNIADRATSLKPGPWGNLESLPLYIEPPEEYLPVKHRLEESGLAWKFAGYTPALLSALFDLGDFNSDQKTELLDQSKWAVSNDGIVINPSSDLIISLSPHSRKVIYGVLAQIPGNAVRNNRSYFPANKFDEYFAKSGLSPDIVELVRKLSFPHGSLLFFCDAPLVLSKLDNYQDKLRLMKVLTRKSTLLLKVHIMPDTDINALVDYWSKGAPAKDIKPILQSLADVPGGARMGIGKFFPRLPRESLYTFPYPSQDPAAVNKDCHWTALNFFNDPPDARYTDINAVKQRLTGDYYPVPSDLRYGDILELVRPNGDAIHSCVFIADNVVYTKNSAQPTEPFMLMTIPDMLDAFSSLVPEGETLKIVAYRSKGL